MALTEPEVELRPSDVMGKVCGTCVFWDPYANGYEYGECRRIGTGLESAPVAAIVALTPGSLTTRAIFGCTLWEEHR